MDRVTSVPKIASAVCRKLDQGIYRKSYFFERVSSFDRFFLRFFIYFCTNFYVRIFSTTNSSRTIDRSLPLLFLNPFYSFRFIHKCQPTRREFVDVHRRHHLSKYPETRFPYESFVEFIEKDTFTRWWSRCRLFE